MSSVAAQTGGAVGAHYAASKAGIIGLTHSCASSLIRDGITVNAIAPALIETDMVTSNPNASPSAYPDGAFWLGGRHRIRGCDAGCERLHDRADDFSQWWLVYELVRLTNSRFVLDDRDAWTLNRPLPKSSG